jgi:hypothetical protein
MKKLLDKFSVEFEAFRGFGFAIGYSFDDIHEEHYFSIVIFCFSFSIIKEK